MNTQPICPCGTGDPYQLCCRPYHDGETSPPTAVVLMRSRFAAYVLNEMAYVKSTWDASSRPADDKINFAEEGIIWQRLEILDAKKGGINDSKGMVEFKAYYSKQGENHQLHEVSRFVKTNGRWLYLDGVIKSVGKIILQTNEGKNAPCPCGSGKKFKRCCGASK